MRIGIDLGGAKIEAIALSGDGFGTMKRLRRTQTPFLTSHTLFKQMDAVPSPRKHGDSGDRGAAAWLWPEDPT